MRYIVVGLAFGMVWAILQWSRDEIVEPVTLLVSVLLCGAFGAFLWGVRTLVIHLRGRGGGSGR